MKLKSILSTLHANMRTILSAALMGATTLGFAQTDMTNLITNPSFENSSTGWTGGPDIGGGNFGDVTNYCAEKWNANFAISQTITGLADGYYQITAKGFYRDGSYSNAASAHTDGTESLHAMLFANNKAVRLGSICNEADIARISSMTSYGNWSSTTLGSVPNSMESAAAAFTIDAAYNNKVYVKVTEGKLTFGVRVTETFNSDSWAIFDDFHLYYYGDTEPTASADIEEVPYNGLAGQYLFYNVGANSFLFTDNINNGGSSYHLSAVNDDVTKFIFNINYFDGENSYIYTYGNKIVTGAYDGIMRNDWNSSYNTFKFTPLPDGTYTIQNINSNYVGWADGNQYVYVDKTNEEANNTIWKLIPLATSTDIDNLFHNRLRDALGTADRNIYSEFYSVLDNPDATIDELIATTNATKVALDLTNYMATTATAGSDYPIYFIDDSLRAWGRTDNYIYRNRNMGAGETQTLTAVVVVTEDATLWYEPYNGNSYHVDDFANSSWSHNYHGDKNSWTYHSYYWERDYTRDYYEQSVTMDVYVDDVLVRTIDRYTLGRDGWRYFEELKPGKHVIKWVARNNSNRNEQYIDIQYIKVMKTPFTEVTLVEPGSLGNEVLQQLNRIQDVRRLKINGPMNADDWTQIDNMTQLYSLDLSGATITDIPAKQLSRNAKSDKLRYLHRVVLPNTLTTIGDEAFRDSYLDNIEMPATLRSIGKQAFRGTYITQFTLPTSMDLIDSDAFAYCMSLKKATLPNTIGTLGDGVFRTCCNLVEATLPNNITYIPASTFAGCLSLTTMPIGTQITGVGDDAFLRTFSYKPILTENITYYGRGAFAYSPVDSVRFAPQATIGDVAFRNTQLRHVVVADSCTLGCMAFASIGTLKTLKVGEFVSIGEECFGSNGLVSVELPTTYYAAQQISPILYNNNEMTEVILKSTTMLAGSYYQDRFFYNCGNAFIVKVPEFLVTTYKQDAYWKNFNIEGFDNSEVDFWCISSPLTLTYRDRFEGNPSIEVRGGGSLHIKGDKAMSINNLNSYQNMNYPNDGGAAMILSEADGIATTGNVEKKIFTTDNIWYAMTMPFDFRVSDIKTENEAQFAIRYYDGASRAVNGSIGNWKDFPADTVVTAGTGFIFRTSKSCNSVFFAQKNGSRQTALSNSEFAKTLQKNPSENDADRGWNLIGNPYQAYYNIHKLNTTAPITVFGHEWVYKNWGGNYGWTTRPDAGSYKAYSIIDDDYAMLPNGAFFIQCPDEATTITFPTAGRQLTSEITDQNGAKSRLQRADIRKLIDLTLSFGERQDETRVVFNPEASMAYETTCDASKFMAEDKQMPQMYTIGADNIHYAINERPALTDASVQLGLLIPESGQYTIGVSRNRGAGTILLHDKELDNYIDITNNAYTFYSDAGSIESRFELVAANQATGIDQIRDNQPTLMGGQPIYNINGQRLSSLQKGINVVGGKKVIVK